MTIVSDARRSGPAFMLTRVHSHAAYLLRLSHRSTSGTRTLSLRPRIRSVSLSRERFPAFDKGKTEIIITSRFRADTYADLPAHRCCAVRSNALTSPNRTDRRFESRGNQE